MRLNTELGAYYRSPRQASTLITQFDGVVNRFAYQVRLDGDDDLEWVTEENGVERRINVEPDTGCWKRFSTRLLSVIVHESQL